MRFTIRRPGNPVASPCSHGTPCRDVPGRVHVGVGLVSAGDASEDRLALAVVRCAVPTGRAGLRRERGIDLLHAVRCLVVQASNEPSPAGGEDAPVQTGLGTRTPSRLFDSSARRAGHAGDVEVLDADQVVTSGQTGAGLLNPVPAPVSGPGVQPCDDGLQACASARPLLGARQTPLQPSQPAFLPLGQAWAEQHFSGRQRGRHGHTTIHTDDLARAWRRDRLGDCGKSDMPTPRSVIGDSVGFHADWNGAAQSEAHPADLGNPHPAGLTIELPDVLGPDGDLPEPLMPSGLRHVGLR